MARILVVGAGFAGLSAAARLAKLRHDVTVLDRADQVGGRLLGVDIDGRRWAAGPPSVTLPGVFRDLFRKSGRPMDALLSISPAGPRRHVIARALARRPVTLDLPFGTRSRQHDAIVDAFGSDAWSPWVDQLATPWDELRRTVLEVAHEAAPHPPRTPTLRRVARALPDRRLRPMAADLPRLDPERAPADLAVWHYVERNFGRWRFDGLDAGLASALATRLQERRVTVETGVEVARVTPASMPLGVELADGSTRPADLVVWAAGEPADASRTLRLTAVPAEAAELPDELTIHDRAGAVRAWRSGDQGWVLESMRSVDPARVLSRHGWPISPDGVASLDVPAAAPAIPRAALSPRPGVWLIGSAAAPGIGLEVTGMATAALAARLGPAPR